MAHSSEKKIASLVSEFTTALKDNVSLEDRKSKLVLIISSCESMISESSAPNAKILQTIVTNAQSKLNDINAVVKVKARGKSAVLTKHLNRRLPVKKNTGKPKSVNRNDNNKVIRDNGLEYVKISKDECNDIVGYESIVTYLLHIGTNVGKYPQFDDDKAFNNSCMFYGPPGTGKTNIAKKMSFLLQRRLLSINTSDILKKGVGDSEQAVRDLYRSVSSDENYPCVLLLDEFDSLGAKPAEDCPQYIRTMRAELLTRLDDIFRICPSSLITIAITNVPWAIDEAIARRFCKRFYVPLPDRSQRVGMLTALLNNKFYCNRNETTDVAEEDMDTLCNLSEGFSGSDIYKIIRNAREENKMAAINSPQFVKVVLKETHQPYGDDEVGKTEVIIPYREEECDSVLEPTIVFLTDDNRILLRCKRVTMSQLHREFAKSTPTVGKETLERFRAYTDDQKDPGSTKLFVSKDNGPVEFDTPSESKDTNGDHVTTTAATGTQSQNSNTHEGILIHEPDVHHSVTLDE